MKPEITRKMLIQCGKNYNMQRRVYQWVEMF